jgi:hypothetical protein
LPLSFDIGNPRVKRTSYLVYNYGAIVGDGLPIATVKVSP